jgi:hypothetical protein
MSKFKVGDRVVVTKAIKSSITLDNYKVGEELIIERVNECTHYTLHSIKNGACAVFEEELEFPFIYNSPLYNALK